MKTFLAMAAAVGALTLAAPAAAQSYGGWQPINQRQAQLDYRIDQGVRSGDLTRAAKLQTCALNSTKLRASKRIIAAAMGYPRASAPTLIAGSTTSRNACAGNAMTAKTAVGRRSTNASAKLMRVSMRACVMGRSRAARR